MITKENLIDFISKNFDELKRGGCADWSQLNDSSMTVKEFDDCERVLTKLLTAKHAGNGPYKSVWAVHLIGITGDIFGSDLASPDSKAFVSCNQAEKMAWNEGGQVIEYVVDRSNYNMVNPKTGREVKEFLGNYCYIARRVVIDHFYDRL